MYCPSNFFCLKYLVYVTLIPFSFICKQIMCQRNKRIPEEFIIYFLYFMKNVKISYSLKIYLGL